MRMYMENTHKDHARGPVLRVEFDGRRGERDRPPPPEAVHKHGLAWSSAAGGMLPGEIVEYIHTALNALSPQQSLALRLGREVVVTKNAPHVARMRVRALSSVPPTKQVIWNAAKAEAWRLLYT